MKIYESSEDYLECILMLSHRLPAVRSIDIVHETGYAKPSISVAMKKLRENGYISVDEDQHIFLTESGKEIAERVYERHRILTETLIAIGVSRETAESDACRIEHDISDETFEKIKEFGKLSDGRK